MEGNPLAAVRRRYRHARKCHRSLPRPAMERQLAETGVLVCHLPHALLPKPLPLRLGRRIRSPAPFTLDEMDPSGRLPERVYTKDELQSYLDHGRRKCRAEIEALTDEKARGRYEFAWGVMCYAELLLDNM